MKKKPLERKIIKALADAARMELPIEAQNERLADIAMEKLDRAEIDRILRKGAIKDSTKSERVQLLADAALNSLTDDEIDAVLASAARANLTYDEIKAISHKASSKTDVSAGQIDDLLLKAARKALSDIISRDYRDIVKRHAAEIIDLGLAVHGGDGRVKAIFGPQTEEQRDRRKRF